jgi:hypothetical protein
MAACNVFVVVVAAAAVVVVVVATDVSVVVAYLFVDKN